jgi:hypothetical protein
MILPDADVLVTFQRSGHAADITELDRLPLVVTDAVWDEVTTNAELRGAHPSVVAEMEAMLNAIAGESTPILPETAEAETLTHLQAATPTEGLGELSVIAFAYHHVKTIPVLIDRRALRRAVEELRRTILSLHGFLNVLRTGHGLPPAVAESISNWYCARNTPVRPPVWW